MNAGWVPSAVHSFEVWTGWQVVDGWTLASSASRRRAGRICTDADNCSDLDNQVWWGTSVN
jgi:hypothetical protein